MADIEIEINGQKLTAKPNQTIIQVADEAGIYIPRFCYHKHLSIAANCRMCLVEVEKSPKTLPACATPVMPGMKVFTKSQKTVQAQRAVMEFLLINHPLDCPICDQGGECELQDLSMGYGSSFSHYDECKRSIADENLGPLISTDMTRCIYCTRCVRFGDEIAGFREMGGTFRGEHTEIGTYVQHALKSEVSGNIIDLCPVGALTSKPYRFTARAWELNQYPSIGPHDCVGTNINVHTRYGKVMRVVTRENLTVNETWIADRDRYSYTGLYHVDRLEEPVIKNNGKWEVVDWQTALQRAAEGLQESINEFGADKIGALASPNSTLEEFYLLQKIMRGLGSPHIDHRLRELDTQDQAETAHFPGLNMSFAELEDSDAILLIGANIQREQPIAALRIRKAALKGASILAINPVDYDFHFKVTGKQIVAPHRVPETLAMLAKSLGANADEFNQFTPDASTKALAELLQGKQKVSIILGALALHDAHASTIRYLAKQLATLTNAKLGLLTDGANSAGAWIAGAIPHRQVDGKHINHFGLSAHEMLEKPRKAYLLMNVEPDLDCANANQAVEALKQAKFVVAFSTYRNSVLNEHANVILPIAPFTETAGTFVNVLGNWQSFNGVASAFGLSRPAWKVLRVLGNFLHLEGFDYESSEDIRNEVKALVAKVSPSSQTASSQTTLVQTKNEMLSRVGEIPIYAVDNLVRRAQPLQEIQPVMLGDLAAVRIHPETAAQLKLLDGQIVSVKQHASAVELPVLLDARIARGAAWIPGGIEATKDLGNLFGEVEIAG